MAGPRFQIISDLHLETPLSSPAYEYFSGPSNFPLEADNIFLLGDIGLISDTQPLLNFLRSLLRRSALLKVFYVLGNHEPYRMTLENALDKASSWETTLTKEFGPRFHLLNRTRIDISPTLTLLGCTLWSQIPAAHQHEVAAALKDINEKHGIWDRSILDHNADHAVDLAWLNETVTAIENNESDREVIILTHHSPTTDPRANNKRFPPERVMNSAFRTDLSGERCWRSSNVKVWAFGHTHFSTQFVHACGEGKRKLVVSNQKGYAYEEGKGIWGMKPVVIGKEEELWEVVIGAKENTQESDGVALERIKTSVRGEITKP